MIRFLSILLTCSMLVPLYWTQAFAQGNAIIPYEADLPLHDQDRFLGEVKVLIQGEKLQWIERDSLLKVLSPFIQADTIKQIQALPSKIEAQSMPLPLHFNPVELRLEMRLDLQVRNRESLEVMEDYHERYKGQALFPAPFGGAVNYQLEQQWSTGRSDSEYFSGQFDSFINMKSWVFENRSYYQSNMDTKWFRGDTRIVKDLERQQIRFQAGDVYPNIQGFMTSMPLGGINVGRNFSLNPYRLPYPTANQEFSLQSRSFVKYFVNGNMIKSEFLPAGNYTANDIPLNNGLNTIVVEATDDLGKKQVFILKTATSINLLNQGESSFDLSYGTPFIDSNFKREYQDENGKFFSGHYQYGLSPSLSASLYDQNQKDHNLSGLEFIKATGIGNFAAGSAYSKSGDLHGDAQAASYQLLGSSGSWFNSQTLTLRYERRSEVFRNSLFDLTSSIQNNYSANYTLPLLALMTVSVGGNYGDVRDNSLADRYGYDINLNFRILNNHNLSLFIGRTRDERKIWNDVAYLFLTISFPEKNDFISTFHDYHQENTRITHIHDNQNRLYAPKTMASIENNKSSEVAEADLNVPTPFADFGGRMRAISPRGESSSEGRGSLRMNSAVVFARQAGDWGIGISRPVNNSFVLFSPEARLRGQQMALKSNSPFPEAQTGPFNEITYNNVLAYQYREIQLDPTMLEEGRSLKQEKFVVFPTYRSAHLIRLEDTGAVMLKGKLVDGNGRPWELQVGKISNKFFFTNREGDFFIEGIEMGQHHLTLEGVEGEVPIFIKGIETGIKDLGQVIFKE